MERAPTSAPPVNRSAPVPATGLLQRKCACGQHTGGGECEECRKKRRTLQRRPLDGGRRPGEVPPVVEEVLRGPGQPLPVPSRWRMEERFGHDFSDVRVHAGPRAAESAGSVSAAAFTVGRNVVFGAGQYAPESRAGERLLAHELAHVVQQRGSMASGPPAVFDSPAHEAEADRAADRAVAGGSSPAVSLARTALQRAPAPKADAPREPEFPGVTHAVGQDPESLLRIDSVTVIELGGNFCEGCLSMLQDLSELVSEFGSKPQRLRFRVFSINEEAEGNEEIARRIKKRTGQESIPQTFVYVDDKLVHPPLTFWGYEHGGRDYKEEIRAIYRSASSRGVYTGMGVGAGIGAAVGGIVGTIAGAVLGGFGGAVLGGLLGSAAGALIGLGIGAAAGALFGKDKGTSPLSKERVEKIQRFQQGLVPESEVDNALARDIAAYLAENADKGFVLVPAQKRALLKVLLAGSPGYQDQRAVIKIVENSSDADILRIFAADEELRLTDLADKLQHFDKEEREYLTRVLDRLRDRFPLKAPKEKTEGLLIDDPSVRAVLRAALLKGNTQTPGKAPVIRECCGVFLRSERTAGIQAQWDCVDEASCPVGEVGKRALQKGGWEPVVVGSFHTHPNAPPQCAPREAPSRADFESFMPDPLNRGGEHYVVGPFNVYLIRFDGSFQILGNTPELLGVPPTAPPAGARSALELEYSPLGKAGVKGECR